MAQQNAVELHDVVVRYGGTVAVDRVSLTAARGRVLALLGDNGAGKTSLVQVCTGFRRPDGGVARVLGLDPVAEHDALTPRLGLMAQSGGMYPWATAGEILDLFASFAARPLDAAMLVDRLGLGSVTGTRWRRLSGGEQQRLALAVALVGRPEMVFLDEPTAGMDTAARHTTWRLVEELRADGVSVLLTTHLLDEAERLADDVVIVRSGAVVATGTPGQLTAAAGVDRLVVRAQPGLPVPDVAVRAAGGGPPAAVSEDAPGEYTVDGELDAEAIASALAWFAAVGARVTAVNTRRRTLEDVYLSLTAPAVPGLRVNG
ncbi:ABC transporter ATP-binding protein [Mangrovihabitans endophyticus]|uniref:ABC transporter ATP-binding protein n=1 Tax=Mangrovihabitans endophyticus TaxID=1751298 RepID=A0A8J3FM44_9ACTN|nr:ABC transporter ATP-binding protein [Mangrovihabitans endophyticus]GGK80487.1 ABC transporter ATP-binding protein [Mangrovihabitans endophyticus]